MTGLAVVVDRYLASLATLPVLTDRSNVNTFKVLTHGSRISVG